MKIFSSESDYRIANVRLSQKPLSLSELLLSTIEPINHNAYWPLSLSTIKLINHWAYWPLSLLTIEPINHLAYWPPSLLTIKPIDYWDHWPWSLSTIKPIGHQAYQPTSLSTSGLLLRLLSLLACLKPDQDVDWHFMLWDFKIANYTALVSRNH